MAKRFIDTDLFKKRFIRDLPPAYKLLWVYLFCECDNAGIWEVDLEVAGLYCGETYDLEDFEKAFAGTTLAEVLSEPTTSVPLCPFPNVKMKRGKKEVV